VTADDRAQFHWATWCEALTDELGDADAVVQGSIRRSWRQLDERAARLASAFTAAGVEPGAKVAQYLYNSPEYIESWLGGLKVGGTAVNVNYRYLDEELLHVIADSDAEVLLFHSSLGERVERIRDRAPNLKVLLEVDDGGALGAVTGAVPYEDAIASHEPAPRTAHDERDITMLYTGGTTGMPKGVMGRIGPSITRLLPTVSRALRFPEVTDLAGTVALARQARDEHRHIVSLPACPLMHGTGFTIGLLTGFLFGGTVVLLEPGHFDADAMWDVVEAERVTLIAVVGDPFARPMLRALEADAAAGRHRDLASVNTISSSGAMFSEEIRRGLVEQLPQVVVLDYISSSEGLMGAAISTSRTVPPTGKFRPVPGVRVLNDDDVDVVPGSGEAGRIGLSQGVPLGYYKDEVKSAATFRDVDGVRYSFPGDWGTVEEDGSISLLGRGSQCINTGGEKVFPEEVEEEIKRQPCVDDCLVFGVADERFGQRVVAVASPAEWPPPEMEEVLAPIRSTLAGYKLPRQLVFVETVPRAPSGKADYPAARQLFDAALV
jgi:fatty-acyl-CoA synthase